MTVTLIWLIAFVVILTLTIRRWDGPLSAFFDRRLPALLKTGGDDRWVWCPAIAVVVATFIVRPIDMLLTLLVLALLIWGGTKLVGWAMKKVKTH